MDSSYRRNRLILVGALVAVFAAVKLHSPYRGPACAGAALLAIGVALSAVGGFGGDTGRSNLWWFALIPYPVGWIVALMSAAMTVRDSSGRGAAQAG